MRAILDDVRPSAVRAAALRLLSLAVRRSDGLGVPHPAGIECLGLLLLTERRSDDWVYRPHMRWTHPSAAD